MNKLAEKKGFTLMESLMAITVLSIVFVAVISVVTVATKVVQASTDLRNFSTDAFSNLEKGGAARISGEMTMILDGTIYELTGEYHLSGSNDIKYYQFQ